ncbi:CRP-like cAMP-binding protein [Actinoplanes octamycinicus]|uniref:CRP-like cAMP-binding protein n=1 Tax=Actinoplanes octamycinicus TaxID=135948 RepID=A0A7W7M9S8_9ACTN|nr:Crp/Fnr family transcriptional regulator [Actinoplanes octamycinicus]MBB4742338.1 CRP-like cAMP-binding protein [Actinoplanes octamycinicus]GIE62413.1 cAMP-binding protein [Actinoplanes octamycinicus]
MRDSYAALAAGLRRWAPIPDAEMARARAVFRPRFVAAGTVLQRAGEPSADLSFVVRGLTRMTYPGAAGRTKGFRAEGDLVCSYAAVLRGGPSQVAIDAVEDCALLTAGRAAFDRLCAGHPAWQEMLTAMTRRLFLDEERRQADLLTLDATARYQGFLQDQPGLAARLTQKQIAAYVGVSPEALSRIRHALR